MVVGVASTVPQNYVEWVQVKIHVYKQRVVTVIVICGGNYYFLVLFMMREGVQKCFTVQGRVM